MEQPGNRRPGKFYAVADPESRKRRQRNIRPAL